MMMLKTLRAVLIAVLMVIYMSERDEKMRLIMALSYVGAFGCLAALDAAM